MKNKELSIVIPVYNEAKNLPLLWDEIKQTLPELPQTEVIMVDDGSTDGSVEALKTLANKNKELKVIFLQKNYGQTIAMGAGVNVASGKIVVILDADLQNDPRDMPKLLSKLQEGYDVVSGWRKNRWQEARFTRKLPSVIANLLISKITGVRIHDAGCTLKAYRADIVQSIDFIGEIHRLIHVHAIWKGARVTEVVVNDRPRKYGTSKYGSSRVFKVLLDLLVAKYTYEYATKPIYFFGTIGITSFAVGAFSFIFASYLKFFHAISYIETPLLLLTVFAFVVGLQFVSIGLIADMILRSRHQDKSVYVVREKIE